MSLLFVVPETAVPSAVHVVVFLVDADEELVLVVEDAASFLANGEGIVYLLGVEVAVYLPVVELEVDVLGVELVTVLVLRDVALVWACELPATNAAIRRTTPIRFIIPPLQPSSHNGLRPNR